jgi:hypothetical protein
MCELVIYSVVARRSDMIQMQYEGYRKFVRDDFRFVILNNEIDDSNVKAAIDDKARACGMEVFHTRFSTEKGTCGPRDIIPCGTPKNADERHALALKWSWETIISKQKERYALIVDSDMFLAKPISAAELLDGHQIAGVPLKSFAVASEQEREGLLSLLYFLPHVVLLDMHNLPDKGQVDWNCGVTFIEQNGKEYQYNLSPGGRWHLYLDSHPEVRLNGWKGGRYRKEHWVSPYDELYDERFLCDFAHDCFFHSGQSSNWNGRPDDYLKRKNEFVFGFVDDINNGRLESWPWIPWADFFPGAKR